MENSNIVYFPLRNIKNHTTLKPKTQSDPVFGRMLGKGLTDETMRNLFHKFSNPKDERQFRDRIIFLLASSTGLRAKELVSLRFSNLIESPEGEILVKYVKKGGTYGFAVILEELISEVKEYHKFINVESDFFILGLKLKNRKNRNPLTTRGLQLIINEWNVTTASGRKIHPHSLRHTVAQKIFDKFGSIAAQKVLGHSSANTTSNYYTRPYFNAGSVLNWKNPDSMKVRISKKLPS